MHMMWIIEKESTMAQSRSFGTQNWASPNGGA